MTLENDISNLKRRLKDLKADKQSAEKARDAAYERAQIPIDDIDEEIGRVTAHLQFYGIK